MSIIWLAISQAACGKAHMQSQWERANFDPPNDIKIPEIFQI